MAYSKVFGLGHSSRALEVHVVADPRSVGFLSRLSGPIFAINSLPIVVRMSVKNDKTGVGFIICLGANSLSVYS